MRCSVRSFTLSAGFCLLAAAGVRADDPGGRFQQFRPLSTLASLGAGTGAEVRAIGGGDSLEDGFGVRSLARRTIDVLQDMAVPGRVRVIVDLGGGMTTLVLDPYSVRSPVFSVIEHGEGGAMTVAAPTAQTYRGFDAATRAIVAATIRNGRVSAAIRPEVGEAVFVQPVSEVDPGADAAEHVVYAQSDVRAMDWRCGSDGLECADCGPVISNRGPGGCLKTVEVVFDADYPFYQANGSSSAATVADIENIVNQCDVIYRRDVGVTYAITQVNVRTSAAADPYNDLPVASVDPSTLLGRVRSVWGGSSGSQRDIVHLMTGRDLTSSTIGIAYVGVVCRSPNVGLSQSRFTSNLSLRTVLTAHEIGHNFGSNHDSSGTFVMAPSTGPSSQQQFSPASISAINSYLASSGSCLASAGPGAGPDSAAVTAPQTVLIDVLANDASACGLALTLSLPSFGTSAGGSVAISIGTGPGGRNQIRYTPPASVPVGGLNDTFTYRITEATTALLATGTVGVTVSTSTPSFCPGDFNRSGAVGVQDLFDYLAAYFAGQTSADFNRSGAISVQDTFDFLAAYFGACP